MKIIKILLSALIIMGVQTAIQAQSGVCKGGGNFIANQWEIAYKISHPIGEKALNLIPIVGQNQDAKDAISEASVEMHTFIFEGNTQSWATLGIRSIPVLDELTTQGGTLQRVGPVAGERTFVTGGMLWDRIEVGIEKLGGGLKTEVVICTWDMETGAKNNVENYVFPNGKELSSKKFLIPYIHGKSISIRLVGKESNFDKFKYRITTRGILNMHKQRQRAAAEANKNGPVIQKASDRIIKN